MKKVKNKIYSTILLGTCMLTLISCGGNSGSGSGGTGDKSQQEMDQGDHGVYRAVLRPLNTNIDGNNTTGLVTIRLEGDEFVVEGAVAGSPIGVKHLQNIQTSSACPTAESDANADGFIDALEGAASYGQILIPLDSNLNEQMAGMDFGPIANNAGSYIYKRTASYTRLLTDLRDLDSDIKDVLVKLAPENQINISGRHVVIYGVSNSTELPSTVATIGDLSPAQSLPIACGQLVRVIGNEETEATETVVETVETI